MERLGGRKYVNIFSPLSNLVVKSGPLKGLSALGIVYTLLLTLAVVWMVRLLGQFESPFWLSLKRGAIGALILLVAYTLAGNVRVRWVSQRTLKYLLIPVFAPLGIFVGYMLTMPSDDRCCGSFFENYGAISGWARMSIGAVLVTSIVVFLAISRERDRDAEDLRLKFSLERERLERQSVAARMEAMRARMEPHFLFNTLANIQQLVQHQSPRASQVLSSLIAYLRTAIVEDRNGLATLAQEFERAKHYLAIMQMRISDRLKFEVNLPVELEQQVVPTFAVLTLVENAVAHGIDPTEHGGTIYVSASLSEPNMVNIDVLDTGAPFSSQPAEGFGLRNLRERLAVISDGSAMLSLQSTSAGTMARVVMVRMNSEEAERRFAVNNDVSEPESERERT
jgi:signal transduction histidine kinase